MEVPYEIKLSKGKGKGVFALVPIKFGTLIWDFDKVILSPI